MCQFFNQLAVLVQDVVIHVVDGNHELCICPLHLLFEFSTAEEFLQFIRISSCVKDGDSQFKKPLYLGGPSNLV